jgi:hypothetical protein
VHLSHASKSVPHGPTRNASQSGQEAEEGEREVVVVEAEAEVALGVVSGAVAATALFLDDIMSFCITGAREHGALKHQRSTFHHGETLNVECVFSVECRIAILKI